MISQILLLRKRLRKKRENDLNPLKNNFSRFKDSCGVKSSADRADTGISVKEACECPEPEQHWGGDSQGSRREEAWPDLWFRKTAVEPRREGPGTIRLTRNTGCVEKATTVIQPGEDQGQSAGVQGTRWRSLPYILLQAQN